jgi:hypothetical protein
LRKSASGRPSICLAIPAFAVSLGSVTDTLKCNLVCVFANESAIAVGGLDVDRLRTIAQEAAGFYVGVCLWLEGCLGFEPRLVMCNGSSVRKPVPFVQ